MDTDKVSGSNIPLRTSPGGMDYFVPSRNILGKTDSFTKGIYIQKYVHAARASSFLVPAVAEPMLVWITRGSAIVEERELDGDWKSSPVSTGDFFLTHSSTPYEIRWQAKDETPFEVMHLYLPLPVFDAVTAEFSDPQSRCTGLGELSGVRDETVSRFLDLIHQEISHTTPPSPAYIEGLVQSLTVHLVRLYGQFDLDKKDRAAGLPASRLLRVRSFFQAHLDQKFDLETCAKQAGLSPYHFARLFKTTTGTTPLQYFSALKIAKSQQLLRETDMGILEIAQSLGYDSPSHFSQIFKRLTGVTPRQFRRD